MAQSGGVLFQVEQIGKRVLDFLLPRDQRNSLLPNKFSHCLPVAFVAGRLIPKQPLEVTRVMV